MSIRVTIIDKFGHKEELTADDNVPRVGDLIQWKFEPHPKVIAVVWSMDLKAVSIAVE